MTGKIKLNAASGGGSVSFQAPSSTGDDRIITLPTTADGTVLTTTNPKAGNIIQVVSTAKTDTASTNSSTFADVFTVAITPTTASSKFLLFGDLKIGYNNYQAAIFWKFVRTVSSSDTDLFIGDSDGSRTRCTWGTEEPSSNSDNAKYELHTTNGTFLDTPNTTSAITYKVKWKAEQQTAYLNRSGHDSNTIAYPRAASSLTVMEVAA